MEHQLSAEQLPATTRLDTVPETLNRSSCKVSTDDAPSQNAMALASASTTAKTAALVPTPIQLASAIKHHPRQLLAGSTSTFSSPATQLDQPRLHQEDPPHDDALDQQSSEPRSCSTSFARVMAGRAPSSEHSSGCVTRPVQLAPLAGRSLLSKMLQRQLKPLPPICKPSASTSGRQPRAPRSTGGHQNTPDSTLSTLAPQSPDRKLNKSISQPAEAPEGADATLNQHASGTAACCANRGSSCTEAMGVAALDAAPPGYAQGAPMCVEQQAPNEGMSGVRELALSCCQQLPGQQSLLAALRAWRQARSRQACKQPSCVLPEAVLQGLAARKPTSFTELQQVPGLSPGRAQQLGHELLDLIRQHDMAGRLKPCGNTGMQHQLLQQRQQVSQRSAADWISSCRCHATAPAALAVCCLTGHSGSEASDSAAMLSSCTAAAGSVKEEDGAAADSKEGGTDVEFDVEAFFAAAPPAQAHQGLKVRHAAPPGLKRELSQEDCEGVNLTAVKRAAAPRPPKRRRAKPLPSSAVATDLVAQRIELAPAQASCDVALDAGVAARHGLLACQPPLAAAGSGAGVGGSAFWATAATGDDPAGAGSAVGCRLAGGDAEMGAEGWPVVFPDPPLGFCLKDEMRSNPELEAKSGSGCRKDCRSSGGGGRSSGARIKSEGPGGFLSRPVDAALKQYSKEEDLWILGQVAVGMPEAEVAALLRRSRNAIVRRVRLLIARATAPGRSSCKGQSLGPVPRPWLQWAPMPSVPSITSAAAEPVKTNAPACSSAPLCIKAVSEDAQEAPVTAATSASGPLSTDSGACPAAATTFVALAPDLCEAFAVRAILSARAAAAVARSTSSLPQHLLDPLLKCIRLGAKVQEERYSSVAAAHDCSS